MEAEAKHDFQATAEDELSFPKNAILKVRKFIELELKNFQCTPTM